MLRLGTLTIPTPFVQAALSGYSDAPMRRLARRYACPYALNEVVLDRLVTQGGKTTRRITRLHQDDHPIGGQLMGSEPEQFAVAAAALVDAGYDVIDINFGCPVKKVLGRCRGGFLLSTPTMAIEILRRVYEAVGSRVPVTLKMRRGMDDSPESEISFFRILDAAFEIGLSAVTVHGRTVKQRYVGPSRWEFLSKVKRHVGDRKILGSGDAFSAMDCVRMLEQTGVDGVSVARGAIGNPWIFREAAAILAGDDWPAPPAIDEQRRAIEQHYRMTCDAYGPLKAAPLMRKFMVRYSELHPCYPDVKMAFLRVRDDAEWHTAIGRWYDPAGDWPVVTRRLRPEALVAAGASWDCSGVTSG